MQFASENEFVAPYKLYDNKDDLTTTPVGRDTGLGFLNDIFDRFEEGRCWREGWTLDEMETRDKGTKFIITKEPDADLTEELGVQNLRHYADTLFPFYKKGGIHPAFFDSFYKDILSFPKPLKNSLAWKRFVKYMRSFLGLKAPLVISTLICEFHRVIDLQILLHSRSMNGIIKRCSGQWRDGLKSLEPFSHIYWYQNNLLYGSDKWQNIHWHVIRFSRNFIEQILFHLKVKPD